jgi:hypothetical protein
MLTGHYVQRLKLIENSQGVIYHIRYFNYFDLVKVGQV